MDKMSKWKLIFLILFPGIGERAQTISIGKKEVEGIFLFANGHYFPKENKLCHVVAGSEG
jgi:hypothetical protein